METNILYCLDLVEGMGPICDLFSKPVNDDLEELTTVPDVEKTALVILRMMQIFCRKTQKKSPMFQKV